MSQHRARLCPPSRRPDDEQGDWNHHDTVVLSYRYVSRTPDRVEVKICSAFFVHPISKERHSSFRYERAVVLSVLYAHVNLR